MINASDLTSYAAQAGDVKTWLEVKMVLAEYHQNTLHLQMIYIYIYIHIHTYIIY